MNMQNILFMSSPFRSGSGLASRILNSHSQIDFMHDKVKFFRFCFGRYIPLNEENVAKMLDDLSLRLQGRFNIKLDTINCYKAIREQEFTHATIYKTLFQNLYHNEDCTYMGEMECLAWRKIPDVMRMFPNGKSLLIIRDLRDVVVSFKKMTIAPGNDYLIALFNVVDAMNHWLELKDKFPNRFFGIRYEALKADPEKEIKKICEFLQIDFESDMLNEEKWMDFTDEGWKKWENRAVSSFYYNGDHMNPVGRWRRLIKEEDLFLCEWIGRRQMLDFGMKHEGKEISQETFDRAIGKITSSKLLRECFKGWCETGEGVEKYPLDPLDPKTWDKNYFANPHMFALEENN